MIGVLPEKLPRAELEQLQCERLAAARRQHPPGQSLLRSPQVRRRWTCGQAADLQNVPPTSNACRSRPKEEELVADDALMKPALWLQSRPYPLVNSYCRLHQTSGTSGRQVRCAGSTRRKAGPGCSIAGRAKSFASVALAAAAIRAVLPVFVRPVHRVLERIRSGGQASAKHVLSRRRDGQHDAPAFPARQRGHPRPLHADLRPAPGRGGPRGRHRFAQVGGEVADRRRRTGRQHPGHCGKPHRDRPGVRAFSTIAA